MVKNDWTAAVPLMSKQTWIKKLFFFHTVCTRLVLYPSWFPPILTMSWSQFVLSNVPTRSEGELFKSSTQKQKFLCLLRREESAAWHLAVAPPPAGGSGLKGLWLAPNSPSGAMTLAGSAAVIEGGQQLPFNDPFTCFLPALADLLQPQVQAATPDSHSGLPLSQILLSLHRSLVKSLGWGRSGGGDIDQKQRAEPKKQKQNQVPANRAGGTRDKSEIPESRRQKRRNLNHKRMQETWS